MVKDLFTGYLYNMMPYALKLTNNTQDAEDLLQDVAEKMIKYKVTQKPYEEQTAICRKAIDNTFKKYKAQKNDSSNYNPVLHIEPDAESRIKFKEVMNALKTINPIFLKPIMMFSSGYSVREISAAMNTKQNTTLGRLRYGRVKINELKNM